MNLNFTARKSNLWCHFSSLELDTKTLDGFWSEQLPKTHQPCLRNNRWSECAFPPPASGCLLQWHLMVIIRRSENTFKAQLSILWLASLHSPVVAGQNYSETLTLPILPAYPSVSFASSFDQEKSLPTRYFASRFRSTFNSKLQMRTPKMPFVSSFQAKSNERVHSASVHVNNDWPAKFRAVCIQVFKKIKFDQKSIFYHFNRLLFINLVILSCTFRFEQAKVDLK